MKLHFHKWEKVEAEPHSTYYDYSGWHVGIFKCQCKICGKMRNRKYTNTRVPFPS